MSLILRRRLLSQRLVLSPFREAADVVAWLGATQAQDFGAAKWAIGLRAKGLTDAAVERAFNDGRILRTHLLRPTWHFVTPADIRWMLSLTGPRVQAFNAHYYRKVGLDKTIFLRSRRALERALRGQQLTRTELALVLRRAGIPADGIRLAYLMMHAELEQVICSGPLRGKQFTYALLDERAPHARILPRAEALAELTQRYFSSRGPATLKDFVWWSGLTAREAKTGIDMVTPALAQEVIDGRTYWSAASTPRAPRASSSAHLLPNYDEYLIAGRDRAHIACPPGTIVFDHHVVIDGQLAGSWSRTVTTQSVRVDVDPYRRLSKADIRAVAAAADRYSQFMNRPVTLSQP